MAENDEKFFRCYWCGKALATDEVVPLMSSKCCGYTASCAQCASEVVERQEPPVANGQVCEASPQPVGESAS